MITIVKPGLLTSIQDLGRYGYQKYGIIASGAMDPLAHRIANLLVGNEDYLPTLEITLLGPTIQFHKDTLIAICGGDLSPTINGKPIRSWCTVFVKQDSELKFGRCNTGCRAYLAVAGGFSIPTIMESKSTYLRAGIGGYNGRALMSGDQLSSGNPSELSIKMSKYLKRKESSEFVEKQWSVSSEFIPIHQKDSSIRVMKGRHFHLFTKESQEMLFNVTFDVTTQSDRMGYRLQGPTLSLENAEEMISEAVNFGTIQVPPDGNPIILLADRQTTGGYPKIGQVATVDLSFIAQAKPGDHLQFSEVSHEESQLLFLARERKVQHLKQGINLKFK